MKYKEIISEIKSVRLYKKEEVDSKLLKELKQYYEQGKSCLLYTSRCV